MTVRRNRVEFQAKSVEMERASNGWIVTAHYDGLYEKVPSIIAASDTEALAAAKGLMSKPFVRNEDEY